jgi:hypothetical protein
MCPEVNAGAAKIFADHTCLCAWHSSTSRVFQTRLVRTRRQLVEIRLCLIGRSFPVSSYVLACGLSGLAEETLGVAVPALGCVGIMNRSQRRALKTRVSNSITAISTFWLRFRFLGVQLTSVKPCKHRMKPRDLLIILVWNIPLGLKPRGFCPCHLRVLVLPLCVNARFTSL